MKKVNQNDSNNIYKKPNWMIEAKYQSTIMEEKLLDLAFANLDRSVEDNDGNIVVKLKASEIRKKTGGNSGSFYTKLDETSKQMTGKIYGYSKPDFDNENGGEFEYNAVITHADYKDGILTLEFNHHLRKHLKDIEKRFTLLNIEEMLLFNNVYAHRLYELLKVYCFNRKGEVPKNKYIISILLSELKFELGVANPNTPEVKKKLGNSKMPDYDKAINIAKQHQFQNWGDFRRGVLDKAVNEINKKTNINVDWTPRRSGKGGKIYMIDFEVTTPIQNNTTTKEETEVNEIKHSREEMLDFADEIRDLLLDYKIKTKDLLKIAETSNCDLVKVKKAVKILDSYDDVNNVVGFLLKAIEEDYDTPIKKKRKSKKIDNIDIEERDYNFDELEKNIVENL